ncbi:MAG TPA: zinc-ribbon domain-containing protein, partial [Ktedonobacteraceae bacterium]|nr:zinc-ribbon domain-containing protein [Ktedonobacteraceae bacterium]
YEKVSDSTMIPPTHRMKSNMEDIAKGMKIAGAISGATIKAVKTIQDTIQSAQGSQTTPNTPPATQQGAAQQGQPNQASQRPPASSPPQPTYTPPAASPQQDDETLFCDQCGAPVRPGKNFCSRCGARLP